MKATARTVLIFSATLFFPLRVFRSVGVECAARSARPDAQTRAATSRVKAAMMTATRT